MGMQWLLPLPELGLPLQGPSVGRYWFTISQQPMPRDWMKIEWIYALSIHWRVLLRPFFDGSRIKTARLRPELPLPRSSSTKMFSAQSKHIIGSFLCSFPFPSFAVDQGRTCEVINQTIGGRIGLYDHVNDDDRGAVTSEQAPFCEMHVSPCTL